MSLRSGLAVLGCACLLAASAAAAVPGKDALVEAIAQAPDLVLAEVVEVEPLLHGGHLAVVAIGRVLRGELAPQTHIALAWEEPVPTLPPRLAAGRRILVAIEPLATASIWRDRIPDPVRRSRVRAIAAGGDGLLLRPSGGELALIEHYIALSQAARLGDAGAVYLARLAAAGSAPLAESALAALAGLRDLAEHLVPDAALALVDVLLRAEQPKLVDGALALIRAERPPALRAALEARVVRDREGTISPASTPLIVLEALAALDQRLEDDVTRDLLASPAPARRALAARFLRGTTAPRTLRRLARDDREPSVRAAALTRLFELEAGGALDEGLRGLGDAAPEVRLAAAKAVAALGADAVPSLVEVTHGGSPDAARTAIASLSLMGSEATPALVDLAANHPDAGVRALASIAIGRPIGHRH